jgi:hypothetical protein
VLWLYLHVLPTLAPGVVVHVHDIFWPFEYPPSWLREHRDWNENYFLHAFLCHNASWQLMIFNSWIANIHADELPRSLRGMEPGSLWMRRAA